MDNSNLFFRIGGRLLTSRQLAGTFPSRYLLDFMKVAGTEKVDFHFNEAATAAEFRPQEDTEGEYTYRYVVMPVRA